MVFFFCLMVRSFLSCTTQTQISASSHNPTKSHILAKHVAPLQLQHNHLSFEITMTPEQNRDKKRKHRFRDLSRRYPPNISSSRRRVDVIEAPEIRKAKKMPQSSKKDDSAEKKNHGALEPRNSHCATPEVYTPSLSEIKDCDRIDPSTRGNKNQKPR